MSYVINRWTGPAVAVALLTGLIVGSPAVSAQEGTPGTGHDALNGAVVSINEGSCDDPAAAPLAELGTLKHLEFADADSQSEGNARLLNEDENGNGVLDEGEDRNGNGTLDSGLDANANGVLDPIEIMNEDALGAPGILSDNLSEIWALESDLEFDPDTLFGEGHVVLVQEESGSGHRVIACGLLTGVLGEEKQQFAVNLMPMTDAPYQGLAVFGTSTGEVSAEGNKGVLVVVFVPLGQPPDDAASTPTS